MRIAIVSDIHSNLEALTKAYEMIQHLNVDDIVCLGDVVGYGANPNECIELVRQKCSTILLGNHDLAAVDLATAAFFTSNARAAAEWTSEQLTPEHRTFLKQLPYTALQDGILFVHASPFEPEEWHYIISLMDARAAFKGLTENLCFVGHSHIPGVYAEKSMKRVVERSDRFIVNVGSVGQPRDGNPKLSFGVFDTDRWEYKNLRGDYNVEAASDKIIEAGLPRALADRILLGV